MFTTDQYELLDFGDGRRLERFGDVTLDRPCPAAEGLVRADPAAWQRADARFDRGDGQEGQWTCRRPLPETWTIAHGPLVLELKRTVFGHLGVFPEHAANWQWIAEQIGGSRPVRVLNLFAYTGGSTLAAAVGRGGSRPRRCRQEHRRLGPPQRRAARAWPTRRSAGSPRTP